VEKLRRLLCARLGSIPAIFRPAQSFRRSACAFCDLRSRFGGLRTGFLRSRGRRQGLRGEFCVACEELGNGGGASAKRFWHGELRQNLEDLASDIVEFEKTGNARDATRERRAL